jgi:hypothetical protein
MNDNAVARFKEEMKGKGFQNKAVVSAEEMARAVALLDAQDGVVETPPEELRYIEGLLRLPLGHLDQFKIVPGKGYEVCACGRTPTALDIVSHALKKRIHDVETIRDTLIGFTNLVEFSEGGRAAECFDCGRASLSGSYWTHAYLYA